MIVLAVAISSGASKGGTKDAPPWVPNYFIFMQFSAKKIAK